MTELRIVYFAGPGDAFTTFRQFREGTANLMSHRGYSTQFYEVCRDRSAAGLVLCSFNGPDKELASDGITVRFTPDLAAGAKGWRYYWRHYLMARNHIEDVRRFKANVVVISENQIPMFYRPLYRNGVRVIQALHCRLWLDGHAPSLVRKLTLRAAGWFYQRSATAIMSASNVITRQVRALAGARCKPIVEFLPTFDEGAYSGIPPVDPTASPLQVAFIGRIEEDKGAFDLLQISTELNSLQVSVVFQVCGAGSALDEMRKRVQASQLNNSVIFHGWCDIAAIRDVLAKCQLVIVPTTSRFVEGFNLVTVEAVLAGRPAIVSAMCPAVNYVGDTVVVVAADDVDGYVTVLARLAGNRAEIATRAAACSGAIRRFLQREESFGVALRSIFLSVAEGRNVDEVIVPLRK